MYTLSDLATLDPQVLFLYGVLLVLTVVELVLILLGLRSEWYRNLKRPGEPGPVAMAAIWLGAYLLSFFGLVILGRAVPTLNQGFFAAMFLLGTLLNLAWALIMFEKKDLRLAIWIMVAILIFEFSLLVIIARLNLVAGLLFLPLLAAYSYLLYLLFRTSRANETEF